MSAGITNPARRRRSAIRWATLIFCAIFVIFIAYGIALMVRGPQIYEHVAAEDAPFNLPPDATDVCGVTQPPFWSSRAYEFTVSEASFIEWARNREYRVSEIRGEPYQIWRYNNQYTRVAAGLFFEEMSEADSGIHIAYDRDIQRAYIYSHTR